MSNQFGINDWLTPLDIAEQEFDMNLNHYYRWLFKLSLTRFEWENLPLSVSERFLELACQSNGRVLFCKPESMNNFIVVNATDTNLNHYGQGKKYTITSPVPITPKEYTDENAVMIYNDDFSSSMLQPLSLYANRIASIERVRSVNKAQLMTPAIIPMEENQRKSYVNAFQKIAGGAVTLFTGKHLNLNDIKSLDLGAKFYLDKLQEDKLKEWNEALTFIGIQNNNNPKRERNITSEIESNNQQTVLSGDIRLKARQIACDKINEMFPELDPPISVKYRQETLDLVKELTESIGGEFNET